MFGWSRVDVDHRRQNEVDHRSALSLVGSYIARRVFVDHFLTVTLIPMEAAEAYVFK